MAWQTPPARSGATISAIPRAACLLRLMTQYICIAVRPWRALSLRSRSIGRSVASPAVHLETVFVGLPSIASFIDPGGWGRKFTAPIDDYANMAGLWIIGEDLPQSDNRITLNMREKDQWGLPVANVHYDDHPNDVAMREHGYGQGSAIYDAIGAKQVIRAPPFPRPTTWALVE